MTELSLSTLMEPSVLRNSKPLWKRIRHFLPPWWHRLDPVYILYLQRDLERLNFDRRRGIMCMFERPGATYAHPQAGTSTGETTNGSKRYR